jgi:hypothetical protein
MIQKSSIYQSLFTLDFIIFQNDNSDNRFLKYSNRHNYFLTSFFIKFLCIIILNFELTKEKEKILRLYLENLNASKTLFETSLYDKKIVNLTVNFLSHMFSSSQYPFYKDFNIDHLSLPDILPDESLYLEKENKNDVEIITKLEELFPNLIEETYKKHKNILRGIDKVSEEEQKYKIAIPVSKNMAKIPLWLETNYSTGVVGGSDGKLSAFTKNFSRKNIDLEYEEMKKIYAAGENESEINCTSEKFTTMAKELEEKNIIPIKIPKNLDTILNKEVFDLIQRVDVKIIDHLNEDPDNIVFIPEDGNTKLAMISSWRNFEKQVINYQPLEGEYHPGTKFRVICCPEKLTEKVIETAKKQKEMEESYKFWEHREEEVLGRKWDDNNSSKIEMDKNKKMLVKEAKGLKEREGRGTFKPTKNQVLPFVFVEIPSDKFLPFFSVEHLIKLMENKSNRIIIYKHHKSNSFTYHLNPVVNLSYVLYEKQNNLWGINNTSFSWGTPQYDLYNAVSGVHCQKNNTPLSMGYASIASIKYKKTNVADSKGGKKQNKRTRRRRVKIHKNHTRSHKY